MAAASDRSAKLAGNQNGVENVKYNNQFGATNSEFRTLHDISRMT